MLAVAAANAQGGGQALLHRHDCYLCHDDTDVGAGPAFVDVARRYRGDPGAVRKLSAAIRNGHASWPWHMPPMPQASAAEARAMSRHILSLDPPPPKRR